MIAPKTETCNILLNAYRLNSAHCANAKGVLKLDGGDSPLVGGHKPYGPKPDSQRQTGVVHDRSGGDGGLMAAGAALVGVPTLDGVELPTAALGADKALGKPQTEQLRSASILGSETLPEFLESDLLCLCHANALLFSLWGHYRTTVVP